MKTRSKKKKKIYSKIKDFYGTNRLFLKKKHLPIKLTKIIYSSFDSDCNKQKLDLLIRKYLKYLNKKNSLPIIKNGYVIFLLYTTKEAPISIISNINNWRHNEIIMTQIGDTNLYYAIAKTNNINKIEYKFVYFDKNLKSIEFTDPINKQIKLQGYSLPPYCSFKRKNDNNKSKIILASENLKSEIEHIKDRPIYVYIPPDYELHPSARYPVLYINDGENVFDDKFQNDMFGGWHIHETCDNLIENGMIFPPIIVAIPSVGNRIAEYSPDYSDQKEGLEGYGPHYIDYITKQVIPFINSNFRTYTEPENTAIVGSSLGGLLSFWAAMNNHEIFGNVGCLSPSFWFRSIDNFDSVDLIRKKGKLNLKIYLDHGDQGIVKDHIFETRQVRNYLINGKWKLYKDLYYFHSRGDAHNEISWRKRFWRVLVFFFGTASAKLSLYKFDNNNGM